MERNILKELFENDTNVNYEAILNYYDSGGLQELFKYTTRRQRNIIQVAIQYDVNPQLLVQATDDIYKIFDRQISVNEHKQILSLVASVIDQLNSINRTSI